MRRQALAPSWPPQTFGCCGDWAGAKSLGWTIAVLLGVLSLLTGCGELDKYNRPQVRPERYGVITNPDELARPAGQAPAGSSSTPSPAPQPAPPAQAPSAGAPASVSLGPVPGTPPTLPPSPPEGTAPTEPPPGYVRERAGVGATGKGNYRPGILTTPLSVYFRAQERIIFESQIPHALQLYHATNGRYPASWEEFEREILVPNGIRLPTLPPGHRYHYDPQTGQLMVEKPAP